MNITTIITYRSRIVTRIMITKKMVSDVHQADEKMDKKTKKAKKKNKRVKFALSSPVDVMDSSTTAPADSGKLPNSSSKSRFQFLHRFFGKIRSFCLPSKYFSSKQKNSDTNTEASSSAAVDRSSEEHRGADLLAATQETEPITFVERIKLSPSFDGSFTSIDTSSDEETQETKPFEDVAVAPPFAAIDLDCLQEIMDSLGSEPLGDTQTSAPLWVSDVLGQQAATEQDSETQGDDADKAPLGLPNLGNTCYMNSVLQCLLSVSPFREDVLSLQEDWKNEAVLLGALSDLHMSRLGCSDSELKKKHLALIKGYIENDYPDFKGNQQQDAHEFLMACLFCLKEESEILKVFCPTYTCPVANMEFRLKRERTCDSCGFQKSFPEDFNYLSLVIGPQACLTDSLQQYLNASSIDCACSQCSGTKASETLKFLSLPQVLVFLVMRFDITSSSMCKLKDQLEIPEELTLSSVEESRKQPVSAKSSAGCRTFLQKIFRKWNKVTPLTPQEEVPAVINAQYRLSGVVSHLGSNLFSGHYISHIRNPNEDGWLRCSDDIVRETSWSEVSMDIETNGYLLFYVKS